VLALYSFPLRQGLLHFAQQTFSGYVRAAGRRFRMSNAECHELWAIQSNSVLARVEDIVSRPPG
jgi:hypothetical protein